MNDNLPRKEPPGKLGGGWFHGTELLEGEEIQMEADVFHKPSRSTQGGILYLTDKRLVYLPDRWAAIVGDSRLEWLLGQVSDTGMTRDENAGAIFHKGYLLVFECMYVERAGERHLFSTSLPMNDREWVAAIKAASQGAPDSGPAPSEEPEAIEPATEVADAADA